MAGKRKRSRSGNGPRGGDQKRQRVSRSLSGKEPVIKQALLNQYYPRVLSLREYLLSRLPSTSKVRKKKICSLGKGIEAKEKDCNLAQFLDQTLVGVLKDAGHSEEERQQQWTTFSQQNLDDSHFANLSGIGLYSQVEIIDFAIWLLFSKSHALQGKNQHLLCQGYRKDVSFRAMNHGGAGSNIPGIVSTYPNDHVTSMKSWPWPQILAVMGKEGEQAMIALVLYCGIFVAVESGRGTYQQLSGQPLGELQLLPNPVTLTTPNTITSKKKLPVMPRSPSSINFVRSRMLYARAALNAQCCVRFGLRHIHVLNRYPFQGSDLRGTQTQKGLVSDSRPEYSTIHVLMYIFPRQFGLHNVFTNEVDSRQTVQPFKDYTLREDEIKQKYQFTEKIKIPKRLRGMATNLVQMMQTRHRRCAYKKLLEYYCPVYDKASQCAFSEPSQSIELSAKFETQIACPTISNITSTSTTVAKIPLRKPSMMDHATPTAMVSAFCRAVLSHIIPPGFWGNGSDQAHNERVFRRNVDRFVELRRFETMSLHEVSQGLKISNIEWLGLLKTAHQKLSKSDTNKRWEMFNEFLYYIFDSLLIPLIRANFHATESNVYRYRLFYFRHDVWRSIAEPALTSLKITMFEEMKLENAMKVLDSRTLGFSQVRLLPKETGVRPIMNLRRRLLKKGSKNFLGSSINSALAPVYNVLNYEKAQSPSRLGATLFSVGDLYSKLKAFKSKLSSSAKSEPLYFAKLDVHAAFDTIPQHAILALISSFASELEYRISKHVEIKPGENHASDPKSKPVKKWAAVAHSPDDFSDFQEAVKRELAVGRKNTVFVENVVNTFKDKKEILGLLEEHILRNMVKIGKKFYRQKEGIPQGSVLSSFLCNFFYADLEAKHLGFLVEGESLLLRLIDDFLLITTNPAHAKRFLEVMHEGVPEYGVECNPDKTLVNFEFEIKGRKLARLVGKERGFPYCGSFIDTKSLDISRDRERRKDMAIIDTLTVEFSRVPGKTFHRKVLNTFKIQSHAMFLDTSFNSTTTVLKNVHSAFVETATKMWMYAKCLPVGKRPGTKLVIQTITDLIMLAFVLMKSKGKMRKNAEYKCALNKAQVEWLAASAFLKVLGKKQSGYRKVIEWLEMNVRVLRMREAEMVRRMRGVIERQTGGG